MRKILNKGFVKLEGTLGSTLETSVFQFHVKAPIFIAKQWFLKQLGSFKETECIGEDFYIPSTFEGFTESECNGLFTKLENYSKWSFNFSRKLIDNGLTQEQARMILPMNTFTSFYWTVTGKQLQHFIRGISMTTPSGCSKEMQAYGAAVAEYLNEKYPTK